MAKIGIDARLYSPKFTGIGRYVFELIKNLSELDTVHQFVVFLNPEEYELFELPNERWQKRLTDVHHYSFAEHTRFFKQLRQESLDVMYFPHFNVPLGYTSPFVVTIHDLTLHYYPYKGYHPKWSLKKQLQIWMYRFLMGRTLKHANQIIAVSQNTKQDILKEYPHIPHEKVRTILEGVPDTFQKSSAEQSERTLKKFDVTKSYLLYTGVWRSHKNLLRLIRAFKILIDQGRELQLVITGKKDPAYPEIPQLISDLGLDKEVILTGFVSEQELIDLNSAAEVFVFPSLYEGFGLPPLEAMQFQVPVACSNRASLPEVCGDAAAYFDPEEIEEITTSIQKILDNPQYRQDLIQKGTENLQRFSWKTMSDEILDLLDKTCNNTCQTKKSPA